MYAMDKLVGMTRRSTADTQASNTSEETLNPGPQERAGGFPERRCRNLRRFAAKYNIKV